MSAAGTGPTPQGRWIVLPHSGWGAFVASQSPPGWVRRVQEPDLSLVREEWHGPSGTGAVTRPTTQAEAESVAEDIFSYLADAGVADVARWLGPWEAWVSDGVTQREWTARVLAAQVHPHPRDDVGLLRSTLAQLAAEATTH